MDEVSSDMLKGITQADNNSAALGGPRQSDRRAILKAMLNTLSPSNKKQSFSQSFPHN